MTKTRNLQSTHQDFRILEKLLEDLQKAKGYPPIGLWNNRVYTALSSAIYTSTGVLLSRNTLKNMVKKVAQQDIGYTPQPTTKQALCAYLGYGSWEAYADSLGPLPLPTASDPAKRPRMERKPRLLAMLGLAALVLAALYWALFLGPVHKNVSPTLARPGGYGFSYDTLTGQAPHTVTFHYNFEKIAPAKAYIDLDTYSAKGVYQYKPLTKYRKLINFCYHHPGYYQAGLYIDHKPVERFEVLITSQGWAAFVYNANNYKPEIPETLALYKASKPEYIKFEHKVVSGFIGDGVMKVPGEVATGEIGMPNNYKTVFLNYQDYRLSGDDFSLAVRFGHDDFGKETHCYTAKFMVQGMRGSHAFQLVQPGCKSYAQYGFSENKRKGFHYSVEGFEHDFSYPREATLTSRGQKIFLAMEGQVFHKNQYNTPIGDIVGLRFDMKCAASIYQVVLKNGAGKVVYQEGFD